MKEIENIIAIKFFPDYMSEGVWIKFKDKGFLNTEASDLVSYGFSVSNNLASKIITMNRAWDQFAHSNNKFFGSELSTDEHVFLLMSINISYQFCEENPEHAHLVLMPHEQIRSDNIFQISFFPDFCSDGIWINHGSSSPEYLSEQYGIRLSDSLKSKIDAMNRAYDLFADSGDGFGGRNIFEAAGTSHDFFAYAAYDISDQFCKEHPKFAHLVNMPKNPSQPSSFSINYLVGEIYMFVPNDMVETKVEIVSFNNDMLNVKVLKSNVNKGKFIKNAIIELTKFYAGKYLESIESFNISRGIK